MFSLGSSNTYHFYRQPCDMRKSFSGLSGLVRNELNKEPASGDVFVFLNRTRTHIKLLHWERGGFVLYYKRLEKGSFTPPKLKNRHAGLGCKMSNPVFFNRTPVFNK